jgi:hypothetical protein
MRLILPLVLLVVVLAFCAVVYAACLAWPKMRPGKRVGGALLLVPHFLLVLCIPLALRGGSAPMGSSGWNEAFFADVLVLFILPLPALAGTVAAFVIFRNARTGGTIR